MFECMHRSTNASFFETVTARGGSGIVASAKYSESLSEREAPAFAELLDAVPVGGTGDGSISMGKLADILARMSFDGRGSTID